MSTNKFQATHPLTGEVATRGTKRTYTHAAWISVPAQEVHKPARTIKYRNGYKVNVEAYTENQAAEEGIISFHSSEALALKAARAMVQKLLDFGGQATYGAVPATQIN